MLTSEDSTGDVARWLVAQSLRTDGDCASAAARLFRQMLTSESETERAAANSMVAWQGDVNSVTQWLAAQMLSIQKRTSSAKTAKVCLKQLLMHGTAAEQCAVEHALIWMVLHTRPAKLLSRSQRQTLLPGADVEGTDWAASLLDRNVIRAALNKGRWWQRCQLATSKFGFDFADEGVNFIWERIEKYRPGDTNFEAWFETVLNNYWRSLHRKWKRSLPKHSEAAAELDRLAHDDGQRRVSRAPEEPTNGMPPPFAATNSFATEPTAAVLTDADLAALTRWQALDRVLFGFETGVWRQLPRHLWDDWLKRAGINGWASETPMGALTPAQCRAVLSKMRNVKSATLAKRWQRLRPAIAKLPSVHRLMASCDE